MQFGDQYDSKELQNVRTAQVFNEISDSWFVFRETISLQKPLTFGKNKIIAGAGVILLQ